MMTDDKKRATFLTVKQIFSAQAKRREMNNLPNGLQFVKLEDLTQIKQFKLIAAQSLPPNKIFD